MHLKRTYHCSKAPLLQKLLSHFILRAKSCQHLENLNTKTSKKAKERLDKEVRKKSQRYCLSTVELFSSDISHVHHNIGSERILLIFLRKCKITVTQWMGASFIGSLYLLLSDKVLFAVGVQIQSERNYTDRRWRQAAEDEADKATRKSWLQPSCWSSHAREIKSRITQQKCREWRRPFDRPSIESLTPTSQPSGYMGSHALN